MPRKSPSELGSYGRCELQLSRLSPILALISIDSREGDDDGTDIIRLTLSKKVIAARLSLQPETLSRLLRRFEDRGLIRVSGPEIAVLDRDALEAVSITGEV